MIYRTASDFRRALKDRPTPKRELSNGFNPPI